MKRIEVTPLELSQLFNVQREDVCIALSACNAEGHGNLEDNGQRNSFYLIYSVDLYHLARPVHLQVFSYASNAPILDLKYPDPRRPPKIEVLVDSSVQVLKRKNPSK